MNRQVTPYRTRIKFCGLTRPADARLAAKLGVDAIGLVFAARSPRRIELAQALAIRAALPPLVASVALFMDNSPAEIQAVSAALAPSYLQFHGSETDLWCSQFGRPYLKAIGVGEGAAAQAKLDAYPGAAALLLDGHGLGQPGGGGQAFDWTQLPALQQPLLLAGGLDAGNVATAIRLARPWAVDVSSGIESTPGVKDPAKMAAFVAAVNALSARGHSEHP